jgi:hypothetical protein
MSFEDRSEDEEEEAHSEISDSNSDGVFHNSGQGGGNSGDHHVLISSTNDIAHFTNKPNFKIIHTLWLSGFLILVTVKDSKE